MCAPCKSGVSVFHDPLGSLYVSPAAATAAAKSLQSCPTLCDPIDGSPPGSSVPGILQARTLEWVAISFSRALLAFKVKCSGGHPWAGGPDVGLGPLVPWGGPLQLYLSSYLWLATWG